MWKKIIVAVLAALIVMLSAAGLYYRAIQRDHYDRIDQASQLALAQTDLTSIGKVERYAGDEVYYVVSGTDDGGQPLLVWVTDAKTTVQSAVYGITGDEAAERTRKQYGDGVHILRVVPGMLADEPVWEVYYERNEGDGIRRYYDYYRFQDGEKLDTWRLNLQS